jgi:hypothetical protein
MVLGHRGHAAIHQAAGKTHTLRESFTRRSRGFSGGKPRRQNPSSKIPAMAISPWPVLPVTAAA